MNNNARQHFFANVPHVEIPRSAFDRPHWTKTTFDAGWLTPIFVDEVLPGDTFNLDMDAFCRLTTPLTPVMDNVFLESFFFFVPYRLIWNNFQKFMGEQTNPGDSTSYLTPVMTSPSSPVGYIPNIKSGATSAELASALSDYFGIPTRIAGVEHCSLFHRSYNLIYNEWFRDQNLQNSVTVDKGDGPDTYTNYQLLRRGKRHDYFTSALPFQQKGTAVSIPLGSQAPIKGIAFNSPGASFNLTPSGYKDSTGAVVTGSNWQNTNQSNWQFQGNDASKTPTIYADLTSAVSASINQLRQAAAIQSLYEMDARGGTRYTEIIQAHFGVTSPDARLQRPEYLGGGSSYINFTPIAQTSATNSQPTPQGNLSAMATAQVNNHGFVKSFTEHGLIIGLVSVRADMTYQYGLSKMFSRKTRLDYYWPELANIGEQAINNIEIYAQGTAGGAADAAVFGYQERHAEYRFKPSMITGKMRSNDPQSLDIWHLAQKFAALPVLNSSFITEQPPIDRVVSVPSEPHFKGDFFFNLKTVRPMPMYSVPGMGKIL